MTIVNQTQLAPSCFGYDKAALSAPSLVGELSVTLHVRDLPHTLFGGLASNAALKMLPFIRNAGHGSDTNK